MTSLQDIKEMGIVGSGGAGFPTHIKLGARAQIFIANAAECEPLLHKDKELLRTETETFFRGLEICLDLVAAERGIIGVKAKYQDLITLLRRHCPARVTIVGLKDFYPVGDEVTLIYETTGRIVPPGALPISQNVVVNNVETIYNIGRGTPLVSKFLSVGGAVRRPMSIEVPIGTAFAEVLAPAEPLLQRYAVIVGGPMMGQLAQSLDAPVTKTTGGLLVFPEDHTLVRRYRTAASPAQVNRIGKAACDQCAICSELCPRHLLGHPITPHQAMRTLAFSNRQSDETTLEAHTMYCCECNLCSLMACPEGLYPAQRCMAQKRRAMAVRERFDPPPAPTAHPLIDYRRTPISKIMARLDLNRFVNTGPLSAVTLRPAHLTVRLDQHIGAVASALVQPGETVEKYQKIATVGEKLGAEIHAPASGRVVDVDGRRIMIKAD